jgi:F-type H+-transporting ATPase subunit epsilon
MKCKIVTPESLFFEGDVDSIIMPGLDGDLGILEDHAPIITLLSEGRLQIGSAGKIKLYQIESGFSEVKDNNVVIFTNKITSK